MSSTTQRYSMVRHAARRTCGWSAVVAVALSGPALAQAPRTQVDAATPFGSPLDPYGQTTSGTAAALTASPVPTAAVPASQAIARVEPVEVTSRGVADTTAEAARNQAGEVTAREERIRRPAPPSEFERYVERALGREVPRFGVDLLVPGSRDFATAPNATVPPSYVLQPGDQVFIGLTGSVEGQIDAEIDTNGRIFIPKVGAVRLAGIPYSALRETVSRAAARQYRDFRVSASVTRLRGLRVYVTGFANNPGAYTVSSLSTMVNAVLAAGGPAAGGSFRTIQLYRNGRLAETFDLYDLVRNGDKSRDAVLQNEDVLYIPAVGPQIAITGSINSEAIYEAKTGESLDTLIRYAGGPSALADQSRIILSRISNQDTIGAQEIARAQLAGVGVEAGDLVQVLSSGTLARPLERQSVVVRIEGEVNKPGNYYVPPNTSMEQVLALAGGLTSRAYVYGSNIQRLSVRQQQRESFQEALQQFEISLAAGPLTSDTSLDPATRVQQLAAARAVLERLRLAEPDGRVVLTLQPGSTNLPGALTLENSDRIYIPPRPTTVGVFGAVYRPASFLIEGDRPLRVRDYVDRAGGPLRAADRGQIFVVRASGEVLSRKRGALRSYVYPGDVVFVPVRTQASSVLTRILQFSTLLFQVGLTAATVVAVSN